MPDATPARRRHVWGVLATGTLVLAAHASVLKWAWHGGSGHANSIANNQDTSIVIGATLLQATPIIAPAPSKTSTPTSTRSTSPPPRVAAPEPTLPATATTASTDTTTTPSTLLPSASASMSTTETSEASETTADATAANTATFPAADTSPSAGATNLAPTDVQLAAAPPDDTHPPSANASAAHLPPSGSWHYQVHGQAKGLSYQAEGALQWQHDGQRYRAHMVLRALWLQRQQTSTGTLAPAGLQPEHFLDQARKTREIWFDPQQHTLHTDNGVPQPTPVGIQDRLSVFFQLATQLNRVAAGQTTARHTWAIPVAGGADSENWHFEQQGHAPLTLPAGTYDTIKLTRQPRRANDQTVEVWLAPALHHIPVRLRIQQGNGDVVDQQLSAVAAAPLP